MSKISIKNEHDETIVGILEKKDAIDAGRSQPRLILITHGVLGALYTSCLCITFQLILLH